MQMHDGESHSSLKPSHAGFVVECRYAQLMLSGGANIFILLHPCIAPCPRSVRRYNCSHFSADFVWSRPIWSSRIAHPGAPTNPACEVFLGLVPRLWRVGMSHELAPFRGVNLGGWLVLEPWIKPSLFEGVCSNDECAIDEHSLAKLLGPEAASTVMHAHWDTFVRYEDLQALKAAGINALRIPVGYWLLSSQVQPGDLFVKGGISYLIRTLGWAREIGLRVVVELHSAPGFQNNMDHSGRKDHMGWTNSTCPSLWSGYMANTLAMLTELLNTLSDLGFIEACAGEDASRPRPCGTVVGIGLLNEPISFEKNRPVDHSRLVQFYAEAIARVVPRHLYALLDMFEGFEWLVERGVLRSAEGRKHLLAFDKHRYVGFSEKGMRGALDGDWLDAFACAAMRDGFDLENATVAAARRGEVMPALVFGEWSVAVNDCMHWLGGAHSHRSSYQCCGVGDCHTTTATRHPETWSAAERLHKRGYAERQMEAMEGRGSLGWFYWNFKTEAPSEWSYLDGIRFGFLPSDAARPGTSPPKCPEGPKLPPFCEVTDPGCDLCLVPAAGIDESTCQLPEPPPRPDIPPCPRTEGAVTLVSATSGASYWHPGIGGCAAFALAATLMLGRKAHQYWHDRDRVRPTPEATEHATPYLAMRIDSSS